jgi:putative flavoprotein involved in K+ transport
LPVQDRGVTSTPGLYLLGVDFLFDRKSGFLRGVGRDARYIADHLLEVRLNAT